MCKAIFYRLINTTSVRVAAAEAAASAGQPGATCCKLLSFLRTHARDTATTVVDKVLDESGVVTGFGELGKG